MAKINDNRPTPPKKAMTAFFLYRKDVYDEIKKQNPDAKMTEITSIISKMWTKLDAATKKKYETEYAKNKLEADNERKEYEKKYGKIPRKSKKRAAEAKEAKKKKAAPKAAPKSKK